MGLELEPGQPAPEPTLCVPSHIAIRGRRVQIRACVIQSRVPRRAVGLEEYIPVIIRTSCSFRYQTSGDEDVVMLMIPVTITAILSLLSEASWLTLVEHLPCSRHGLYLSHPHPSLQRQMLLLSSLYG